MARFVGTSGFLGKRAGGAGKKYGSSWKHYPFRVTWAILCRHVPQPFFSSHTHAHTSLHQSVGENHQTFSATQRKKILYETWGGEISNENGQVGNVVKEHKRQKRERIQVWSCSHRNATWTRSMYKVESAKKETCALWVNIPETSFGRFGENHEMLRGACHFILHTRQYFLFVRDNEACWVAEINGERESTTSEVEASGNSGKSLFIKLIP